MDKTSECSSASKACEDREIERECVFRNSSITRLEVVMG